MNLPTFSIVICNHNYGRFVAAAVESCLAQDYPPELFEVIVVDDGSSDDSRSVLQRFEANANVVSVHQDNLGQAAALAAGIERASHDVICFLDSDDLYTPDKLKRIAARILELAPLPEYFFLCHDLALLDDATAHTLGKTWFHMLQLGQYGAMAHIDTVMHEFAFSIPCGQVMSKALAQSIASALPTWEWRQGADAPFGHAALLIAASVHYLDAPLGQYRIHGANHIAQIRDGEFHYRSKAAVDAKRWPKLLYFLDRLIDHLDLDSKQRASRLAYVKRLERTVRNVSVVHRYADPPFAFAIVGTAAESYLLDTLDACLAQTHPKVEVVLLATGDTCYPLPLRMATAVRRLNVPQEATPMDILRTAYGSTSADYFCFLDAGDIPDPLFVERHLHIHRFGALCGLSSCDIRFINPEDVLLHAGVFSGAGLWTRSLQPVAAFSAALNEWILAPLSANVFRRSRVLDLLFDHAGTEMEELNVFAPWLLLQFAHNIGGSVRINESLISLRVSDAMQASYGRLLDPALLFGATEDPDYAAAALIMFELYCRNEASMRAQLPAQWHEHLVPWLLKNQPGDLAAQLRIVAARAGARAAIALIDRAVGE